MIILNDVVLVMDETGRATFTTTYADNICFMIPPRKSKFSVCARVIDRYGSYTEKCSEPIQVSHDYIVNIKDRF